MASPSLVILSEAKNPGISAQGKLREPGEGHFIPVALEIMTEQMTTIEENPLVLRVRRISRVLYVLLAVAVFVGDQITKSAVEKSIPLHATIRIIPHFFNLTYTRNPGAAFGLFADSPSPWKTAVLIAVSVALLVVVAAVVWKSARIEWEAGVALALIVGGATSNLSDRVRFEHVTDFLDFYFHQYHWFTFNLADSAIVVGAFLLVIHLLTPRGYEN